MKDLKDIFRGCLIGGALGDALGYEIEFSRWPEVCKRFGTDGIQDLDSCGQYSIESINIAPISDDTQMTLFTAEALIHSASKITTRDSDIFNWCMIELWKSYKDWYTAQNFRTKKHHSHHTNSWLLGIPEMHARRAPGITCMRALENKDFTLSDEPVNHSKGCGGVMRTAPIGLFFNPEALVNPAPLDMIALIGAESSALTHGHPLGYIPSAALALIINKITFNPADCANTLTDIITDAVNYTVNLYTDCGYIHVFKNLMDKSIILAQSPDMDEHSAIKMLGEGWVAEEALAIAIYSVLKYPDNFRKAIQCAVNHDGDSDSTGAIAGNILGAYLGLDAIKDAFILSRLELHDVIIQMADQLFEKHIAPEARVIPH